MCKNVQNNLFWIDVKCSQLLNRNNDMQRIASTLIPYTNGCKYETKTRGMLLTKFKLKPTRSSKMSVLRRELDGHRCERQSFFLMYSV